MMANQKGFTMLELMVTLGITGMLVGVLVPFIFYITRDTEHIVDNTTAITQVQAAGRSISTDVKMAADTIPADAAAGILDNLTLQWITWDEDSFTEHQIQYYLSGEELIRNYDTVETIVARYISDVDFSRSGSVITIVITSTVEGAEPQTEKGTYYVTLRQE
jgi:prepilin-type N-terminal cleavage/methylation domain-containing protein